MMTTADKMKWLKRERMSLAVELAGLDQEYEAVKDDIRRIRAELSERLS